MKRLILVRHAKSSWNFPELSDHDRPLNKRGQRDAPKMAHHIAELFPRPELFISSTSVRTNQTARHFLEAYAIPPDQILQESDLYHPGLENFVSVISSIADRIGTVMMFSHNPGVTSFVNRMTKSYVDNVPTCGVAVIDFEIESWKLIDQKSVGNLAHYYYPKGI